MNVKVKARSYYPVSFVFVMDPGSQIGGLGKTLI